jgi:hypothetical protein
VPKPSPVANGPKRTLLGLLGEYKELITVLVFFLGGVVWIFGYFATKKQLDELRCLFTANIDFVQGQMDSGNLSQMAVQNFQEVNPLLQKPALNLDEQTKLGRLKVATDDITRKLTTAHSTMTQAANRLRSGGCSSLN